MINKYVYLPLKFEKLLVIAVKQVIFQNTEKKCLHAYSGQSSRDSVNCYFIHSP